MRKFFPFFLSIFIFLSCSKAWREQEDIISCTSHTCWLKMQKLDGGATLWRVWNPWKAETLLAQYLLIPDSVEDSKKDELLKKIQGDCQVIRTPLKRLTLSNSCHAYLLHELGAIGNVAAMCETEYVSFAEVKKEIEAGRISDCGSGSAPNIETILASGSDAILVTPFESQLSSPSLQNMKIQTIYCAEYMEISPLAQAEWMRFYGALVGKEAEADSLFAAVEAEYLSLITKIDSAVSDTTKEPKILAETPYQGTWFVPGGGSTMGILYRHAGYDYPWKSDSHAGSLPLSPESVLVSAKDADVWVFKYHADHDYSLGEFLSLSPYFAQFKAAQNGEIYGCNTMLTDYYDIIPFRPDILLSELKNLGNNYFKRLK